ncbi:putative 2-dehydropantoate 2-reductase [Capsicum baccatum]|uniref:2-dehydropantoate 2-reductase n=1 Tax=Capsicum baccatum TaxID=33114 RepID=A0A2G2V4U4_CAPBA|nr:putative 2-dehydropantoate 2-reductase [Capsicum baccatum]
MFMRFNPQTLKDAIKIVGMQQKALGAVEKMGKRSARDVKPITRPFTPKISVRRVREVTCIEVVISSTYFRTDVPHGGPAFMPAGTDDGVVTKGKGYGIHSIRVDGNDALAVFTTVQEARKIVVNEHKPVLVEVNCTLFEIEAYASCGSVVNCFFYVQHALRMQVNSRLQAKKNVGADKRHQYKGQWT